MVEVGYGYFLCTYCDYENDRDVIAIMNLKSYLTDIIKFLFSSNAFLIRLVREKIFTNTNNKNFVRT